MVRYWKSRWAFLLRIDGDADMKPPPIRLDASAGLLIQRLRPALILATVTLCLFGCEPRNPGIDVASVERVITTLSADEMLGRGKFTDGIDKAADFIRDEFASIGLEVLHGADDYLQRFAVYRLQIERRRVVLNGIEIPSERVTGWAGSPSVRWTTGDSVDVIVIGPEDAVQWVNSRRMIDRNTLILISSIHQAFFSRMADDLASSYDLSLDPPSGATRVCVLTDETKVTSYEVEITAPMEEFPLTNVVGGIPGRRESEIVLFGAHYDGIGVLDPVDGDSIANGANDDASGTTAVIELARYFKAREKPERTLMFVAFTAEESGFLGSKYLARQLNPTEIITMLNLEAMGKVDPQGRNRAHFTGFDRSDVGAILQRAMEGTPYFFYPDPYVGQALFRRSDNAPFASLGVPAHTIATISMDPRDEDLHQVTDEVETLDLIHMTGLIQAIALGATPIISGEATPTRIDPPLGG
jgi:hypothetical protein